MQIEVGGKCCLLRHDGSAFLPTSRALLVSDLHIGKDAGFRANGLPVPMGADARTLDRLSDAVLETGCEHVFIVGDLWHSRTGSTAEVVRKFEEWIQKTSASVHLIEGNHDRHAAPRSEIAGLQYCGERHELDGICLVHDPIEADNLPSVCGHIHPGIRIEGKGRQSIWVRAFWRRGNVLILPAFGDLTGQVSVDACADDDLYALGDGRVFPVPTIALMGERSGKSRSYK